MALRKQPRSMARELALLSISQIKTKKDQLNTEDLDDLILALFLVLIFLGPKRLSQCQKSPSEPFEKHILHSCFSKA